MVDTRRRVAMRSLRRNHVEQFRGVRPKPIAERPRVTAQVRVLWTSLAAGVALFVSAPFTPWQVALLLGWDAGAIVFVVWEWWDTWRLTSEETRELAKRDGEVWSRHRARSPRPSGIGETDRRVRLKVACID